MSTWFEIALIVFLAMIVIALIGIRDAVENAVKQMGEMNERLDELCEAERDRKASLRAADEPNDWDVIAK
jgi:hypothetical protein